ncbi:hypothetical protein NCC49_004518 [Naganishia albida]|nr:hypothetical protein NCC49_004518 [Naganishia albida]
MEVDTDALPADIPEAQDIQHGSHDENDGHDANDATTSKKKAPRKPRAPAAKPADRVPGTTSLPVARVKRILGADEDLQNIGKEALFLLSIATEQFLKRMADSAYLKARMDGRTTITMRDLSSAVKQNPEMEFLSDIVPAAVPLTTALASRKKNAQDPKPFSNFENQPLSSLIPQVPMLPSRNPDFPDALVRRPKDLSKGKAASARKNAAAAEAEAEAGASEGAAAGEAGADADQGGEESGTPVGTKKAVKGKPKARKSVLADPAIEAGLEKTLAEQSARAVLLGHPKPVKKAVPKVHDLRSPSVEEAPIEVMDDGE